MQAKQPRSRLIGLQDLAALANAHATLVGDVGVPDGVLCIEADTVGNAVAEIGPHSPVRKATVGLDVEGRELSAVQFGHDQGRIVGRHCHTVGKGNAVRHLPGGTVRGDDGDGPRDEIGAGHQVEARGVDIGVGATVDDDLIPVEFGETGQIGMGHQRAVGFEAQDPPAAL